MAVSNFDIDRARSYFELDDGVTYLNHASHSPLPLPVRAAFENFFDSWQKTAHRHDAESYRIFEEVRAKLAGMIGVMPERVGLSPHTTYGMSILSSGLSWKSGDNMVLSEMEFPASVYPWLMLKERGVEIRWAKTKDGIIDEDAMIGSADRGTRIIHTSWVQYNNGNRVDLGKLGEFCNANDILLSVDGIQGMGVIPIDLVSLKIDHFTSGCQKWMLGPCGTGFYYFSERAERQLVPPLMGWLSVEWNADFTDLMRYGLAPRKGPSRFEIGTYAFQDWRALNAAIDIMFSFDPIDRWKHIGSMTQTLIDFVGSDSRLKLLSPTAPNKRAGIVTFNSDNSKGLYEKLSSLGFVLSYREGAVRVSPHFYNNADEIGRLIAEIDRHLG
jgi:selenocysteine lyase/cysteine desulfurase